MPGPARLEELIAALQASEVAAASAAIARQSMPGQIGPADTILALAWATFDVVRTADRVAVPFAATDRDGLLGALAMHVRFGPVRLLLEQPAVEAGLSAYLSRHGEGLAAIYLDRPRFMPPANASGRPPKPIATALGRRGWLLPHEWPWGPFAIALEPKR